MRKHGVLKKGKSRKKKLQTGVEMIILLAAGLSILLIIITINQGTVTTVDWQIRSGKARALVDDIANAAELVYPQGEGAKTRVFVNVPGDVRSINFSSGILEVTFRNNERVYRTVDFNVTGELPNVEGNMWVVIESRENESIIYNEEEGYCGNDNQEDSNNEECDGYDFGGETCITQGFDGGDLICLANCTLDTSDCTICGDGLIEGYEDCEGEDLNGETCITLGYDGGDLSCAACAFNTSDCFIDYPPFWTLEASANNTNPNIMRYVEFYSRWADDFGLDSYLFSWSAGGACNTWVNLTWTGFQAGNWTNTTMQIPAQCIGRTITYRFYANDSAGQMNETSGSINVKPFEGAMIIYYDSGATSTPAYRLWNGTELGPENFARDVGGSARYWNLLKSSPVRNEKMLGTLDISSDVNVQAWNGSEWGPPFEMATSLGGNAQRRFSMAYEQLSGDALVVYKSSSSQSIPGYRIWNGTEWSAESSVQAVGSGGINWITMESKPGSDEIMLVTEDGNSDIYAQVWDGDSWGNVQLLETDTESNLYQTFDAVYEKSSGNALVAWSNKNSNTPRYRVWDGSAWSAQYEANSVGSPDIFWIRLGAEPESDRIIMGTLDKTFDLNVQIWDGSAWGAVEELSGSLETISQRCFDIKFESNSGRALIAYPESGMNSPTYRLWDGSWSSPLSAIDVGGDQNWIVLEPDPDSNAMLMLTLENEYHDASFQNWNGSDWTDYQEIEESSNDDYESIAASYDQH